MEKALQILFLILLVTQSFSQNKPDSLPSRPLHNLSLEFGTISLFSINYERLFIVNSKIILTGKIGFGLNTEFNIFDQSPPQKYFVMPNHITALFGKRWQFFEVGIGGTFIPTGNITYYFIHPIIGYRMQPTRSKIMFRPFLSYPLYSISTKELNPNPEFLIIFYGISVGINFQ